MKKIIGLIILIAILSCKSEKKEKEFIDSEIKRQTETEPIIKRDEPMIKSEYISKDSIEIDSIKKTEKLKNIINSEN